MSQAQSTQQPDKTSRSRAGTFVLIGGFLVAWVLSSDYQSLRFVAAAGAALIGYLLLKMVTLEMHLGRVEADLSGLLEAQNELRDDQNELRDAIDSQESDLLLMETADLGTEIMGSVEGLENRVSALESAAGMTSVERGDTDSNAPGKQAATIVQLMEALKASLARKKERPN